MIRNSIKIVTIALTLLLSAGQQSFSQTNVVPDDLEFQALKALYDSLGGASWTTKTNWPSPGSWPSTATAAQMGTWFGVVIVNGDVSRLTLSGNNLTGKIPAAISQLKAVSILVLHANKITKIPAAMNELSNVKEIWLGNNLLAGDLPDLSSLSLLEQFSLRSNPYLSPAAIPSWIPTLTNLRSLDLVGTKRTGSIPQGVSNLSNLLYLDLSGNQLTGTIPSSIGTLVKLISLALGSNQLSGSIPPEIGNLTKLTNLDLISNLLTGPIPDEIGNLTLLMDLRLYNNQLSGSIPNSIGNLTQLGNLLLYINQLSGPIPSSIGNLTKLQNFYAWTNKLTGPLPSTIGNMTALKQIYLYGNQLSGPIPSSIGNLSSLTILSMYSNQLSGEIPISIGNLSLLTSLYLNNNKLSGQIPVSLGGLTNLVTLDLSSNQFSGSLPQELSGLAKISSFTITSNQFSGAIPSGLFSGWIKLSSLQIGNNFFTGDFPASISNCPLVTNVRADFNALTTLPSSILSLPVTTTINFENNELVSIPNFSNHVNKINLVLSLKNNQIDFAQLEPLIGTGIKTFTYAPQKDITDVPTISLQQNNPLVITTRPSGQFSTVTWEKLNLNGTTWASVTANDQDVTPTTFTRTSATTTDEGTYRWKMTNTKATGMTLQSAAIVVKTTKRFAMDQWGFQYKYDSRKRMVAKKVPGADWVYMVYDNRDRLVLTQDAEQRKLNKWSFTKYDELNRPILTGIRDTSVYLTQAQMQGAVDAHFAKTASRWGETYVGNATGNVHGYTNKAYPVRTGTTTTEVDAGKYLTVTYYDNYNFIDGDPSYSYKVGELTGQYADASSGLSFQRITGQVTGTKIKVLDGTYNWLKAVNYYDDKLRVVQTISDNVRGDLDRATQVYDFTGKILSSKSTQYLSDVTWKDMVGVSLAGTKLTGVGGWGNAGAASVQQLPAGQNGWMRMAATGNNISMVGLSDVNTDANLSSIDYAFYLSGTTLQVFENGVSRLTVPGNLLTGEVLQIERTGTTVKYRRNGLVVYTSNVASNTLLMADAAFNGGSIASVKTSFGSVPVSIARTFEYDHAGRLTKTLHSMNNATPVLLAQNVYNELGQLVDKKEYSTDNGTTFKQSVDYRYNIRGWLTSINNSQLAVNATNDDTNDLFGMELGYNNSITGLGSTAMFNGNISAMKWSVNQGLGKAKLNQPVESAYKFTYDPLNRILGADYRVNKSGFGWGLPKIKNTNGDSVFVSAFDETGFSYDYNGNIKSLTRKGQGGSVMDVMTYDYGAGNLMSNQLLKVSDTGDKTKGFLDGVNIDNDYTYDANGNMTVDKNKGIITSTGTAGITYNHLNLPDKIMKISGDYIKYIYDATGRKLSQQVFNSNNSVVKKTDYVGEYIYENDVVQFVNHEEGRIIKGTSEKQLVPSSQLMTNSDGASTLGFYPYTTGSAGITSELVGQETYLKAVAHYSTNASGVVTTYMPVKPGKTYQFRVKGYRQTTVPANLYVYGEVVGNLAGSPQTLPLGAGNEAWVVADFTVPINVAQVKFGVVWSSSVEGETMYLNKIELYETDPVNGMMIETDVPNAVPSEYQYHLKDHLGNVRLTFTTKDDVQVDTATMETAKAAKEQSQFINYAEAIEVNSPIFDHTNAGTTFYSARLTGTATERIGLAKSLSVMPGDKIDIEVFAKYLDTNPNNLTSALASFIASIATGGGAPAGTIVDGGAAGSLGNGNFPFQGLLPRTGDTGTGPKAYLNYLVFDRDYVYKTGGFKRLTTAARETGADIAHERLAFDGVDQILISEPGYVYIWLSNENDTPVEVYFDDFKVTHTKSPVIQQQDYYPFGLTYNSYQRENSAPNQFLYNGKELQDELNLGWLDYGARMYMPEIGRWSSIDPLAEKFKEWSMYSYALNDPVNLIDIEGKEPGKGGAPKIDFTVVKNTILKNYKSYANGIKYAEYSFRALALYNYTRAQMTQNEIDKLKEKMYSNAGGGGESSGAGSSSSWGMPDQNSASAPVKISEDQAKLQSLQEERDDFMKAGKNADGASEFLGNFTLKGLAKEQIQNVVTKVINDYKNSNNKENFDLNKNILTNLIRQLVNDSKKTEKKETNENKK